MRRTNTEANRPSATSSGGVEAPRGERTAIWEANARKWPSAGPPWRPSPGDVATYRRLLAAADLLAPRSVVLFGVTPELRDVFADAASRVTIVDSSAAMYAATSSLLREADVANEKWIQ